MSGGSSKPPTDWREGLKGMRDRLPNAPAKPQRASPPIPAKKAMPVVPVPPPAPDATQESALFEQELDAQGVAKIAGADAVDMTQLPHASGPAVGETPVAGPPLPPGPARLKGDRRALPRKLDLHGHTLDAAINTVKVFLSQHRDLGSTEVSIVTGHGQNRGTEAVLRPEVLALLDKHPAVARVDPEGPGAFRVTLRSRRP